MAEEIKWGNEWRLPDSGIEKFLVMSEYEDDYSFGGVPCDAIEFDNKLNIEFKSEAHLTFECDCGAIHDPETNSFTKLWESARSAEWSIKFRDIGYNVKCRECK